MNTREYEPEETAPFCSVIPSGSKEDRIEVTLPDGQGGVVEGILSPEQARSLTLGLRSTACMADGKSFFAGGWAKDEVLREIANDYTRMREGGESEL